MTTECAFRVTQQGDVTVTHACIVEQSLDAVLIDVWVGEKWAYPLMTVTESGGLPGVCLVQDEEPTTWTQVIFPDYAHWRVYATAGFPFVIHVCLVSPSVEE